MVKLYDGFQVHVEDDTATEEWARQNVGTCGEGLIVAVRSKHDKRFALKIVLSSRAQDQMRHEVELCMKLGDNQYFAMYVRAGRFEDLPCHITPFAEHLNLEKYIRRLNSEQSAEPSGEWSAEELREPVAWLFQIACGLTFLHYWGIIHCDMKPKNVLVYPAADGERARMGNGVTLKICDLGFGVQAADHGVIVRGFDPASHGGGGLDVGLDDCQFDYIVADCHGGSTEGYAPPECHKDAQISDRYDVWGLFLIALYVLNGCLPPCLADRQPDEYRAMIEQEQDGSAERVTQLDRATTGGAWQAEFLRKLICRGLDPFAHSRPSSLECAKLLQKLILLDAKPNENDQNILRKLIFGSPEDDEHLHKTFSLKPPTEMFRDDDGFLCERFPGLPKMMAKPPKYWLLERENQFYQTVQLDADKAAEAAKAMAHLLDTDHEERRLHSKGCRLQACLEGDPKAKSMPAHSIVDALGRIQSLLPSTVAPAEIEEEVQPGTAPAGMEGPPSILGAPPDPARFDSMPAPLPETSGQRLQILQMQSGEGRLPKRQKVDHNTVSPAPPASVPYIGRRSTATPPPKSSSVSSCSSCSSFSSSSGSISGANSTGTSSRHSNSSMGSS